MNVGTRGVDSPEDSTRWKKVSAREVRRRVGRGKWREGGEGTSREVCQRRRVGELLTIAHVDNRTDVETRGRRLLRV